MRKVSFLFLLLLELFFLTPLTFAAEPPSCNAFVGPDNGVAGTTRFSISGNVENFPRNADASISIIDTKKIHTMISLDLPLVLSPANNSGNFGPIELNPFYLPSVYVANIYYMTTVRGTISHFLCSSNTFTVNPSLTPTKLECDPPGRDPKDQSKCRDLRCTPTGRYQCLLNAIEVPTPTPTPTPIPTPTPTSPVPPCAQWEGLNENGKYVPISKDRIREYFKNGELKPNQNVKCVSIDTAIGEISIEPEGFVKRIFSLVLGLAGGIALILIMISGYKMMASQGNPEAIVAARDQLLSAVIGLLFIIFSFVILQVIGVDILRIPGFMP